MEKKSKIKLSYLIILFTIISFIGWCIETIYFLIYWNDLTVRGFLTLPLCTIYGCSIVAIYLIIGTPRRGRLQPLFTKANRLPIFLKILSNIGIYLIYFIIAALIPTVAEFFTGLFFDKVFGVMLWDYSYRAYDLFGYICLEMTVLWGVLITFAMGIIWPLLEKLVLLIPHKTAKKVAAALVVLIALDFIFNCSYLLIKRRRFVLF